MVAEAAIEEAGNTFIEIVRALEAVGPLIEKRKAALIRAFAALYPHSTAIGKDSFVSLSTALRGADPFFKNLHTTLLKEALLTAGLQDFGLVDQQAKFDAADLDLNDSLRRWFRSLIGQFSHLATEED